MTYTFTASNRDLIAWGAKLRRLGANKYSDLVGNPILFNSANGTMTAILTLQGQTFFSGQKVPDVHLSESELHGFAGDYYSDELGAAYKLSLLKGVLTLKVGDNSPIELNPVATNEFQAGDLGTIVFPLKGENRVSSMTLFSRSARGISFEKRD